MDKAILEVKQLTTLLRAGRKNYPIVENISFNLYRGKTLALVGESGCGKSMTALSIMKILPHPPCLPSLGEVLYDGVNLLTLSDKAMNKIRGAKIGMIFQDPTSALNPVFTIGDQLIEVAQTHLNLYGDDAKKLAIKGLSDVGIPSPHERLYDYPHQLSGGMRQRVMIAMALMCEPDILIADEPTTALDVTIQAQVLEIIRELQRRRGMALLLITHDMGVVAEMADEVIVMYAGQGIEKGKADSIFYEIAHPYTLGLFKSKPGVGAACRSKLQAIKGSVPPMTRYPAGCRFHPRCPFVMAKCPQGEVPEFLRGGEINTIALEESHVSKCWLWDGSDESEERRQASNWSWLEDDR